MASLSTLNAQIAASRTHGAARLPHPVVRILEIVCQQMDVSVAAVRGTSQSVRLVRARAITAQIAAEICPRVSAYGVDKILDRGSGWCIWTRSRHLDRCEQFPSYAMTFERCRQAALAAFK